MAFFHPTPPPANVDKPWFRWATEDHPDISEDSLNQLEEFGKRQGRAWQERRFGIVDEEGAATAVTKLRSQGKTAWVEDVYRAPRNALVDMPACSSHTSRRSLDRRITT